MSQQGLVRCTKCDKIWEPQPPAQERCEKHGFIECTGEGCKHAPVRSGVEEKIEEIISQIGKGTLYYKDALIDLVKLAQDEARKEK